LGVLRAIDLAIWPGCVRQGSIMPMSSDTAGNAPEIMPWTAAGDAARPSTHGRHVGLVLPCYNEEGNVDELYERLVEVFDSLPQYTFEMLFIDNASTDGTVEKIKALIDRDPRVKLIVNARNFGHIRSPFHGLMESGGDCAILMCTDLQDPPELIPRFLEAWENGASAVVGQKRSSEESHVFWALRSLYYRGVKAIADVPLLEHVTGFGLYDRRVLELLREDHVAAVGACRFRSSNTISRCADGASPRTTFLRCSTWQCWELRVTPRRPFAWLPSPGSL